MKKHNLKKTRNDQYKSRKREKRKVKRKIYLWYRNTGNLLAYYSGRKTKKPATLIETQAGTKSILVLLSTIYDGTKAFLLHFYRKIISKVRQKEQKT